MTSFSREQKLTSHHAGNILMYLNQTSSGTYSDMLSGNSILPHNYSESVGGQNEKFIAATATADTVNMQSVGGHSNNEHAMLISRGLLNCEQNIHSHGLSLSLGSHMPSAGPVPSFQSQYSYPAQSSLFNPSHSISQKGAMPQKYEETPLHKDLRSTECMSYGVSCSSESSLRAEALCNPNSSVRASEILSDPLMHGGQGYENTILNSKYLRPAQELLDEMANVQKALKRSGSGKNKMSHENCSDGPHEKLNSRSQQTSSNSGIPTSNSSISELSPAERQDLLDKKAKLMSMLDEVDEKYRQYCHEMQIVVSSFDMVAGCGAAEPYTALALRTISRHFRCLRDAISGQIQLVQRKLGEQEGIPRLRYVDQQLRQQRSLHHLGVIRQAWRPQRGLPESSVSVLRAWLFEHFLHPYPKDSEKLMLARQTGLSRNQVANWFINARVRLWKPMIEEMYQEEFGESEMLGSFSQENTPKKSSRDDGGGAAKDGEKEYQKAMPGSPPYVHMSQFNHTSTLQMDERASRVEFLTSTHGDDAVGTKTSKSPDKNNFYSVKSMPSNTIEDGDLMSTAGAPYDLSELGHLAMNGQVSLALELRNCESDGYHGSGAINKSVNETSSFPGDNDLLDYHFMDPGKEQQRFGNPHLLHEFVV